MRDVAVALQPAIDKDNSHPYKMHHRNHSEQPMDMDHDCDPLTLWCIMKSERELGGFGVFCFAGSASVPTTIDAGTGRLSGEV